MNSKIEELISVCHKLATKAPCVGDYDSIESIEEDFEAGLITLENRDSLIAELEYQQDTNNVANVIISSVLNLLEAPSL